MPQKLLLCHKILLVGKRKGGKKHKKSCYFCTAVGGEGIPFQAPRAPLPSFSGKGRFSRQILVGVPCTATEPRYVVFFSVRETELSGRGSEIKYAHGEEGIFLLLKQNADAAAACFWEEGGGGEIILQHANSGASCCCLSAFFPRPLV